MSPLVLLHCTFGGSGSWFKNIASLNRSVLAIDLPGFGESERHEFSPNPEADWVLALETVIQSEITQNVDCLGNYGYWLCGHSFGGYLAAALSVEKDDHLLGVIFIDPWGFSKGRQNYLLQWIYPSFNILRWVPEWLRKPISKWWFSQGVSQEYVDYNISINEINEENKQE